MISNATENLYQIDLLAEQGLSIEYNHTASAQELASQYDVIICCSGLRGIPALEGLESIPHAEVRDFCALGRTSQYSKSNRHRRRIGRL